MKHPIPWRIFECMKNNNQLAINRIEAHSNLKISAGTRRTVIIATIKGLHTWNTESQLVRCFPVCKLHLMWRSLYGSCWFFDMTARIKSTECRFYQFITAKIEIIPNSPDSIRDTRMQLYHLVAARPLLRQWHHALKLNIIFCCSNRPLLLAPRSACPHFSKQTQTFDIYSKFNWRQQQHHCFPSLASIAIIRTRRMVADSIFIIVTCRSSLLNVWQALVSFRFMACVKKIFSVRSTHSSRCLAHTCALRRLSKSLIRNSVCEFTHTCAVCTWTVPMLSSVNYIIIIIVIFQSILVNVLLSSINLHI